MHLVKVQLGQFKVLLRHFKDEIIKRNKFDPIVKTKKNIPYLVDQHLLEKENA